MNRVPPHPWKADEPAEAFIPGNIGQRIADVNNSGVCEVYGRDVLDERRPDGGCYFGPTSEATTRLILAAPDLLSALEWIADRLERGGRAATSDAISQARAAIAKATGQ